MTSLTPCQDAVRRVCAQGLVLETETAKGDGFEAIIARIRIAMMEPLLLAAALEIDNGARRDVMDSVIVNILANVATSLGGMTRVGSVFDEDGTPRDDMIAASILQDAIRLATSEEWAALTTDHVEAVNLGGGRGRQ